MSTLVSAASLGRMYQRALRREPASSLAAGSAHAIAPGLGESWKQDGGATPDTHSLFGCWEPGPHAPQAG